MNRLVTTCLQTCNNLCVFTRVVHDLLVTTCALQELQESSKQHIAELEEEKTSLEKDIKNNLKALLEKGVIKLTKS